MPQPKKAAKRPHRKDCVKIEDIKILPDMQMRAEGVPDDHAEDLSRAVKRREKLPRVQVFQIDKTEGHDLVCVDGFGRIAGHLLAGKKMIDVEIYKGSYSDALLHATAANKEHLGLKRTGADKRRAVEQTLDVLQQTEEEWSNRRIAEHCGVSDDLVAAILNDRAPADKKKPPKPSAAKKEKETPWASMPIGECFGPEVFGHLKGKDCPKNLGDVFDRIQAGDRMGLSAKALSDVTAVIEEESGKTVSGRARLSPVEEEEEMPKSGTVKGVDWSAVKAARDLLMRLPDRVNDEHPGQKDTPYAHGHRRNMKAMMDNLDAWKRTLDKLGAEKAV